MFKVSKLLYQSSQYDNIIYKWHNCLRGSQKWNKNNYTTMHKIIPIGQILLFEVSKNHIGCKGEARTYGLRAPLVPKGKLGHMDRVRYWCQRES